MATRVLAILGTYRRGGALDSVVDAVLAGARENGAETSKVYLLDKHIEFCTNCRSCSQLAGPERGKCVLQDDMESILTQIAEADTLVLGAPVNCGNVTAIFRRFMERLVGYTYWPWNTPAPSVRTKTPTRKVVLVTSSAMPGFFVPFATGAIRALKMTAKLLGARPVGTLCVGLAAQVKQPKLSPATVHRAEVLGARLA
jgi:NAD(P)H-dependent FMN reductase